MNKFIDSIKTSAKEFEAIDGEAQSVDDVYRFGKLINAVRHYVTEDRSITLWLEDEQCVARVSAAHILAEIAKVVAQGHLDLSIAKRKNLVGDIAKPFDCISASLDHCLQNLSAIFAKHCLSFDFSSE